MTTLATYRGRFAPSPTGELHFGSLVAALASCCDARHHHGRWSVRIDNIDPPREQAGATASILGTLQQYGFVWDDNVIYQRDHQSRYVAALHLLNKQHLLYPCCCTRRQLASSATYPGYCRPTASQTAFVDVNNCISANNPDMALRLVIEGTCTQDDLIQDCCNINLTTHSGDCIVQRRDGLVAYALACAVDDADNTTHVVRGADLHTLTPVQMTIMSLLKRSPPEYAHVPIAVNKAGYKLSKQTQASAISELPALPTLIHAWNFLGQTEIHPSTVQEFWNTVAAAWQRNRVPKVSQLEAPVHLLA